MTIRYEKFWSQNPQKDGSIFLPEQAAFLADCQPLGHSISMNSAHTLAQFPASLRHTHPQRTRIYLIGSKYRAFQSPESSILSTKSTETTLRRTPSFFVIQRHSCQWRCNPHENTQGIKELEGRSLCSSNTTRGDRSRDTLCGQTLRFDVSNHAINPNGPSFRAVSHPVASMVARDWLRALEELAQNLGTLSLTKQRRLQ